MIEWDCIGHKGGCTASPIQPVKCTVVFHILYVFVCVCLSYVIKNCVEQLKTGIWEGQHSYEHSTGESGLVVLVDWEHETRIDYIVSAPATALRRK